MIEFPMLKLKISRVASGVRKKYISLSGQLKDKYLVFVVVLAFAAYDRSHVLVTTAHWNLQYYHRPILHPGPILRPVTSCHISRVTLISVSKGICGLMASQRVCREEVQELGCQGPTRHQPASVTETHCSPLRF